MKNKVLYAIFLVLLILIIVNGCVYFILYYADFTSEKVTPIRVNAKDVQIQVDTLGDLSKIAKSPDIKFKYFFINCPDCIVDTPDLSKCYEKLEESKNNPEFLKFTNMIELDFNQISKIEKKYDTDGLLKCFYYQYI